MTESLNSNMVLNPKLNSEHNKWRTITGDIVGNSAVSECFLSRLNDF